MNRFAFVVIAALLATSASATEVAKVNGQSLTDKDIRNALGAMNESMRDNVLKDANSRRQILNALIEQELLVDVAHKEKLDQEQEFKDAMKSFERQYLANRALHKSLNDKVNDSAAKKYYDEHKSRYSTDRVHAQHILLSDEAKAKEVLKLAQAAGTDFQELAAKYSIDPSVKNNRGDLGAFGRDNPFDPVFSDAAFSGTTGQIVGPVKTSFGYHLVKIVEKTPGKPMNYDEVSLKVKRDLSQAVRNAYLGKLKEQAKIEINDKALDHI